MKAKKSLKITCFKLEKRRDKKTNLLIIENVPIIVDFKFDSERATHPIGYRIDASKWNETEQRVRRNNFNKNDIGSNIINARISKIEKQLPIIYNDLLEKNKVITKKAIIESLNQFLIIEENQYIKPKKEVNPIKEEKVCDYIQKFIDTESMAKQWSSGTIAKITTLKEQLFMYAPKLEFDDITEDFLINYINNNIKVFKLNNATNDKRMKIFKWFLNWATKKGYNEKLDYRRFEYKFKGLGTKEIQENIVFLNWDELFHLSNYDLSHNKSYEQVRDIYCFCCYTSLRYSDVKNLKKSDVKTDEDGRKYIELVSIKSIKNTKIPLINKASILIDKYKNIDLKDNKAFPVLSNQKYNESLKKIMKLAGFTEKVTQVDYIGNKRVETTVEKCKLLTSHTARKTFIIIALNKLGMSPDIVKTMTGHSDWEAMKPYIKTEWELTKAAMIRYDEL